MIHFNIILLFFLSSPKRSCPFRFMQYQFLTCATCSYHIICLYLINVVILVKQYKEAAHMAFTKQSLNQPHIDFFLMWLSIIKKKDDYLQSQSGLPK
jgi:hypothetical protein